MKAAIERWGWEVVALMLLWAVESIINIVDVLKGWL